MPKIFKHPDHHNKPHIVLVKGVNAKHTVDYIYKGMENIDNKSILRACEERGNIIIYFKKASKNFNPILNSNKSEISLNRSKLRLIISGFVFCCEKELNNNKANPIIKNAIDSLHLLAHSDISQDITVEDLKKPLSQILKEIATPPAKTEIKKPPQKSEKKITRGLDRDALSKFNRMSEVEFSEVIRFIDPPIGGSYFAEKDDTANISLNKLIVEDMQKFIAKYLKVPVRRIPTSTLAKIARESANIDNIKIFCEKWAAARKGMVRNRNEGKSLIFVWRESMDAIVICLNKHLFRSVGASEIYSRIFKSDMPIVNNNLFASPIAPKDLLDQAELRSIASPLSPATLVAEDSTEKKLQGILRKVRFTTPSENIKQQLTFTDSPISPINVDRNYPATDSELDGSQDLDHVPSTLSPSTEEKVNSLLPDEAIFSPSVLPGRTLKRTHQNSAEVDGRDTIDKLLAELTLGQPIQNITPVANVNNQGTNDKVAELNQLLDDDLLNLLSEFNSLSKNSLKHERTPEKPDPDAPQSLQDKIKSTVRKASSKLTYEPMSTQQVLNSNPNPSITNAINNSINNRN